MCDTLAGRLGVPLLKQKATKLLSLWRHRHDFPAAKWKNVLGQTLARCVALQKQAERQVLELRVEAADYLKSGLLHRADDKVALAIQKHKMCLAYLLIQGYCEQAINHVPEIEVGEKKECPVEAREAISSLLYVMPRCEELVELHLLKPLITSKFGKLFVSEVAEHSIQCAVDKKIMVLLSWSVSKWPIRKIMLEKIADDFNINWRSDSRKSNASSLDEPEKAKQQDSCINVSAPSSLPRSSATKDSEVNCKHKCAGKVSGKNQMLASSSSRKSSVECIHQPSKRKLYEVMLLNTPKLENGSRKTDQAANKESGCAEASSGLQTAIQNASNATLAAESCNEVGKIYVSSDDSDTDDGEGAPSKLSRRPSQLPQFDEVKARLMILQKKKQHIR